MVLLCIACSKQHIYVINAKRIFHFSVPLMHWFAQKLLSVRSQVWFNLIKFMEMVSSSKASLDPQKLPPIRKEQHTITVYWFTYK